MYDDDGDDMLGWTVWNTYKQCHIHWPSLWCLCRGCSATFFMHAKLFSCVQFFVTLWTVACQAPSSMGFSRQDWERELPWNPSDPGIESTSLTSPALADRFFTISAAWEAQTMFYYKAWAAQAMSSWGVDKRFNETQIYGCCIRHFKVKDKNGTDFHSHWEVRVV